MAVAESYVFKRSNDLSYSEKSKWLYREHKIPELGEVFYACTGRTYEGDRTGISQEKIKQRENYKGLSR